MSKIYNSQIRILWGAVIVALLSIIGHVILTDKIAEQGWVEYFAAAIPFMMFGLCIWAIRDASKSLDSEKKKKD
jgi:Na+/H+ antiporter NhaC